MISLARSLLHGKGLGSPGKSPVLKSKVHSWLVQKKEVLAFVQAKPADGGAGAPLHCMASVLDHMKILKFSKSGNHRAQVKKITVMGNMRIAAGGELKRATKRRTSVKKKSSQQS